MPLFQKSVVNKYLSNLDSEKINKLYSKFLDVYGNTERIQNIIDSQDEMSWTDLFEKQKAQALAIKEIINKTDNEIDQMVYEL